MALKKEKTPPAPPPAKEVVADEKDAPKKKGGPLKLIIIGVAAMVIGIGGTVAVMTLLGGGSAPPAEVQDSAVEAAPAEAGEAPIEAPRRADSEAAAPAASGEEGAGGEGAGEGEAAAPVGPQNIELKPFIANLGDGGGKRYLKLTMSVEAETPELAAEINQKMPQFRDLILMLLSSLSYDDISSLDGKMRLRNQMLNRLNTQLSSGKVKNIYFSEFVVQ